MFKFFKKLAEDGKNYLLWLDEHASPYIEKLKDENKQAVEEASSKELPKNKAA